MDQTRKQPPQPGPWSHIRDHLKTGSQKLSIVRWDVRMLRWAEQVYGCGPSGSPPPSPMGAAGSLTHRGVAGTAGFIAQELGACLSSLTDRTPSPRRGPMGARRPWAATTHGRPTDWPPNTGLQDMTGVRIHMIPQEGTPHSNSPDFQPPHSPSLAPGYLPGLLEGCRDCRRLGGIL